MPLETAGRTDYDMICCVFCATSAPCIVLPDNMRHTHLGLVFLKDFGPHTLQLSCQDL